MPTYSYFCKACDEPYEITLSTEEKETWNARCPKCGADEGKQELFGVASARASKARAAVAAPAAKAAADDVGPLQRGLPPHPSHRLRRRRGEDRGGRGDRGAVERLVQRRDPGRHLPDPHREADQRPGRLRPPREEGVVRYRRGRRDLRPRGHGARLHDRRPLPPRDRLRDSRRGDDRTRERDRGGGGGAPRDGRSSAFPGDGGAREGREGPRARVRGGQPDRSRTTTSGTRKTTCGGRSDGSRSGDLPGRPVDAGFRDEADRGAATATRSCPWSSRSGSSTPTTSGTAC